MSISTMNGAGHTSGVIRVQHDTDHPYKVVNTSFATDARLSWAARGVLIYLLSKPNDWRMMVPDLVKQSSAGRDAVYAILKNLEECGYLRRVRTRRPDGTFEFQTVIYETAQPLPEKPEEDEPEGDDPPQNSAFPHAAEPLPAQPEAAKPDIYRIGKVPIKEKIIKDTTTTTRHVQKLVGGSSGSTDLKDPYRGEDGEQDEAGDTFDDNEAEDQEAQQAELVDQLVAIGLWKSKAIQAVRAGTVRSNHHVACCKRFLATSSGGTLWNEFLSLGEVPPIPRLDGLALTPEQRKLQQQYIRESERKNAHAQDLAVPWRAREVIQAATLKSMPAARPVAYWREGA